jgi:hypothetical protein
MFALFVVCLWLVSFLLNKTVNQHYPCALLIMSFQILLVIWQNPYIGNIFFFKWFNFSKRKNWDFFYTNFSKQIIYKTYRYLYFGMIQLFVNYYFNNSFTIWISNTHEKL